MSPVEKVEEKLIRIGRNYSQNSYQKRIDSFIHSQKECTFIPILIANSPQQKAFKKKNQIDFYDHLCEGRKYKEVNDLSIIYPECYFSPSNSIRKGKFQQRISKKDKKETKSIKASDLPSRRNQISKVESDIFKSLNLNNKRKEIRNKESNNSQLEIIKSQIFEKIFRLLDRDDEGYISKSHITITSIVNKDLSMPIFKIFKEYLHRIETNGTIVINKMQFLKDSNKIFNSLAQSDQNRLLELSQSSSFKKIKKKL